jgi:hypothetical protein
MGEKKINIEENPKDKTSLIFKYFSKISLENTSLIKI